MDKGIYTALSGGVAKSLDLELIANNVANANTPGYKRDSGMFQEALVDANAGDKSLVKMQGVFTDYGQGALQRTNRSLDLALEGKGFFEILTPSGLRYTRQGNFSLSTDGTLVTANGFPVVSDRGESIRLGTGAVEISPEGVLRQNGENLAAIAVREFQEPQYLEKAGNSYYRNTRADNLLSKTSSKLHQGFIEMSNVNAVTEMTRLIEATRAYESHMQAIKTYQEIDGQSVSQIAGR